MRWRRQRWWVLGFVVIISLCLVARIKARRPDAFIDLSKLHLVSDRVEGAIGKRERIMSFTDSAKDLIANLDYDGDPRPAGCDLGMCGSMEFVLSTGQTASLMEYMMGPYKGVQSQLHIDIDAPRKPFFESWWRRILRTLGI